MIERVCAATIKGNEILMVRQQHGKHDYWTLPGGSAEEGETDSQAIVREVREETRLEVKPVRLLFEKEFHTDVADSIEQCFLCPIIGNGEPLPGYDPELDQEHQILKEVAWFALEAKKDDIQVREVLAALMINRSER